MHEKQTPTGLTASDFLSVSKDIDKRQIGPALAVRRRSEVERMDDCVTTYTTLEVLTAVFCCLGNMLVILALWSPKTLKQPTLCLIVSLATADFLVGCVAIPSAVMVDGRAETSVQVCLVLSCVVITLTLVSVLCLLAIALDRFFRVCTPLG